jgi:hypothetical protein
MSLRRPRRRRDPELPQDRGTAFAGIVGEPNKLKRRIAEPDLVARDPTLKGYRLDPLDATVLLAVGSQGRGGRPPR